MFTDLQPNRCACSDLNQESIWRTFLEPGPQRIGRKYVKALYREFTDATFTQQVPRPEWMGFLGPFISGEQGDTIRIVFKNMAYQAGRNFSMHPHGAQYTKENEGEAILFPSLLFSCLSSVISTVLLLLGWLVGWLVG